MKLFLYSCFTTSRLIFTSIYAPSDPNQGQMNQMSFHAS